MATWGGRFDAIVLAAGSGSRFGGGKLLAPWREGILLDGALAAAFAAPIRSVTVVTGSQAVQVAAAAMGFAERSGAPERLRIVHADDHAEGMGASLRRGARAAPTDCEGLFVFLGDMPRIPVEVLPGLAAAIGFGADAAAPAFEGRRGHPAVFGKALIPALQTLSGDEGARRILAALDPRLALVEAPDDGVLFDVDRPGDLDGAEGP
jgi:molybdenum cofactor cytidylyltransferase